MAVLTDSQVLDEILADDMAYVSTFMQIPPKDADGERTAFIPWPVQRRLVDNMTGRDLVLKDSQCGCTSIWLGIFLKRTITTPDTTTVIVAHKEFLAQRLLQRAQVMYSTIPNQIKPDMFNKGAASKTFPDINSILYIGTAKSETFGRGEPIHNLLFSEEAFYPPEAYKDIIHPAMQRVPPNGTIVRESTPNGESGSFYEEVQLAKKGLSTYTLQSVFWWDNPDNILVPYHNRAMPGDEESVPPWPEELAGVEEHGWTEDQLRWRHWKISESRDQFFQEHMESHDTCFLVVGLPFYDSMLLLSMIDGTRVPTPGGPGKCEYWEVPEEGAVYVIGGDPGQGKITESALKVIRADLERPRLVATLSGLIPPEPFAAQTAAIAKWYNNALIVPEANGHGLLYCSELSGLGLNLYMRKDIVSRRPTMEIGWLTTGTTKPFMMQEIARQLPNMEIPDAELLRQLRGWHEIEGKLKPETSTADDHHDAYGLALCGMTINKPQSKRGFKGISGWRW